MSNLSLVFKTVERLVVNRMNVHVNQHCLFPVRQSAYRKHHSTETAVTIVHNEIVRSTDAGFVSALVLLDLSAAFDTVDHAILLEVLTERFGVENLELDWFRSYHTGCTQTFTTPSGSLTPVALTCSVPQGSAIGPNEFIVYTKDVKETIDRFIINHHLYENDSQLLAYMKINAVTEHRRRLETCVESLRDWCSSRRLQLNPDKTELIWFGFRANLVKLRQLDVMSLNLCSVAVEPVNSVRAIGVILDSELSMRVRISKISSTCFFHLRRLRKLRPLIDSASA